jgi:hypothetical protein
MVCANVVCEHFLETLNRGSHIQSAEVVDNVVVVEQVCVDNGALDVEDVSVVLQGSGGTKERGDIKMSRRNLKGNAKNK